MRVFPLIFLLMACAASIPEDDACGASGFEALVGQSQDVFAAMTFPETTRFIYPDTLVTMDFNAERLNFNIDENGIITGVRCG